VARLTLLPLDEQDAWRPVVKKLKPAALIGSRSGAGKIVRGRSSIPLYDVSDKVIS
jgi:hypothetical protein